MKIPGNPPPPVHAKPPSEETQIGTPSKETQIGRPSKETLNDLFLRLRTASGDDPFSLYGRLVEERGVNGANQAIASQVGRPLEAVARDLASALASLLGRSAAAPLAHSDGVVHKRALQDAAGAHVADLLFTDITKVQAHVLVVPDHATGGASGGIARFVANRAADLGLPQFEQASRSFHGDDGSVVHQRGASRSFDTGINDSAVGPARLTYVASVPPPELRLQPGIPGDDDLTSLRLQHGALAYENAFEEALRQLAALQRGGASFTSQAPGLISLPLLCTGADGCLSLPQSALLAGRAITPGSASYEAVLKKLAAEGIAVPPFRVQLCYFDPAQQRGNLLARTLDEITQSFSAQNAVDGADKTANQHLEELAAPHRGERSGLRHELAEAVAFEIDALMAPVRAAVGSADGAPLDLRRDASSLAPHLRGLGHHAVAACVQIVKNVQMKALLEGKGELDDHALLSGALAELSAATEREISNRIIFGPLREIPMLSDAARAKLPAMVAAAFAAVEEDSAAALFRACHEHVQTQNQALRRDLESARNQLADLGGVDELVAEMDALLKEHETLSVTNGALQQSLSLALTRLQTAEAQGGRLANDLSKMFEDGRHDLQKMHALEQTIQGLQGQLDRQAAFARGYRAIEQRSGSDADWDRFPLGRAAFPLDRNRLGATSANALKSTRWSSLPGERGFRAPELH